MDDIIKIENLTKDYGGGKGIFGVTLTVKKGETFGLVGTNGSGKTTTMRLLSGFISPSGGRCSILNKDCKLEASEISANVDYVPGAIAFPDVGTAKVFLTQLAKAKGIESHERMNYLINLFKLDINASLKRMSKGMKQKTAIVAAFMADPEIYLLDEPTTGLDPLMCDNFLDLISEEKRRGKTIFLSSNIFKEIEKTCDKMAVIHNGKIINISDREMEKQDFEQVYQFDFFDKKDYEAFKKLGYEIVRDKPEALQLTVSVLKSRLNKFLSELSGYKIKYLEHKPFDLNYYFNKLLNIEENK
jgi:ABC-2 type transport system ATP-binding protein